VSSGRLKGEKKGKEKEEGGRGEAREFVQGGRNCALCYITTTCLPSSRRRRKREKRGRVEEQRPSPSRDLSSAVASTNSSKKGEEQKRGRGVPSPSSTKGVFLPILSINSAGPKRKKKGREGPQFVIKKGTFLHSLARREKSDRLSPQRARKCY